MLLDSEKVKNKVDGIESLKKDSVKKSKVSGLRHLWAVFASFKTSRFCFVGLIS